MHGLSTEALEVSLDVAEAEEVPADPSINRVRNGTEAGCMPAGGGSMAEPAGDKEEAVDHLVEKRGDKKAAAVPRVAEDGGAEDNERLPAAGFGGGAAEGRGADNVGLVGVDRRCWWCCRAGRSRRIRRRRSRGVRRRGVGGKGRVGRGGCR